MVCITASQQTFLRMDLNPGKPVQWESRRKVYPFIKRLFLPKSIPDVPLAGRLKHFVGAWMKITQDPNGHSKRVQNSILFKTFSVKNHSPTNSESKRQRIGEAESKRNVEKGSHQKSSTIKRGVCKQLIPCQKKDGVQKSGINLK